MCADRAAVFQSDGEIVIGFVSEFRSVALEVPEGTVVTRDKKRFVDIDKRMQRRKNEPWFTEAHQALQLAMKVKIASDDEMEQQLVKARPLYFSDPKLIDRFRADFKASSMSLEALKGSTARTDPLDLTGQLKQVKAPALIVVGKDDFIRSPAAAQRVHLTLRQGQIARRGCRRA